MSEVEPGIVKPIVKSTLIQYLPNTLAVGVVSLLKENQKRGPGLGRGWPWSLSIVVGGSGLSASEPSGKSAGWSHGCFKR